MLSLIWCRMVSNETTRFTETTSSIIDLIFSNNPETISSSGVLYLGISDHRLVYAIRKYELPKSRPILKEVRDFKHFSVSQFRADLLEVPWDMICHNDPHICWMIWKSLFCYILNKHAPLRQRRIRAYCVPWITPSIKQLVKNRDFNKKKAVKHNSKYHRDKFKSLRNKVKYIFT